ncbi:energy transducer TonB [Marinomonas pontica]|uniref:energy transducer TonB n=1 Tax=Marinomonas pontica TaxID=264739 RepID=UPI0022439EE7|nr:energy transducer TonB [Marinomonas pontica]MCW8356043.1 energy transducer TonB [Marinomonas pontica]
MAHNKRYPRASRRRNEEGVVSLSFVAHADGSVSDVSITKSSGYKRLDNAVLDMIKRSVPLPVFTKGMVESELRINLPVSFKLSDYR